MWDLFADSCKLCCIIGRNFTSELLRLDWCWEIIIMVFWSLFFLWLIYLFIWVLGGNEEEVCLPWSFWVLLQKQWTHMTFCLLFKEAHLIFCYANAMFLDDRSLNELRMLLGRGAWGQLGEGWIWLKQIIWNSQRTNKKDLCFSQHFLCCFPSHMNLTESSGFSWDNPMTPSWMWGHRVVPATFFLLGTTVGFVRFIFLSSSYDRLRTL